MRITRIEATRHPVPTACHSGRRSSRSERDALMWPDTQGFGLESTDDGLSSAQEAKDASVPRVHDCP